MNNFDWSKYNEKVVNGEVASRRMPEVIYGEDDMNWLESGYVARCIFNAYKVWLEFSGDRDSVVPGFTIFGTLVSGVVRRVETEDEKISDIDIVLFRKSDELSLSGFFDEDSNVSAQIINLADLELQKLFNEVSILPIDGQLPKSLLPLKYAMLGIPFGKEIIEVQKSILEAIKDLEPGLQEKVWEVLSLVIRDAETGRNNTTGTKYGIVGEPLTFQQFVDRWNKRVVYGKKICEKYGFDF